jgi:hypothetical protein
MATVSNPSPGSPHPYSPHLSRKRVGEALGNQRIKSVRIEKTPSSPSNANASIPDAVFFQIQNKIGKQSSTKVINKAQHFITAHGKEGCDSLSIPSIDHVKLLTIYLLLASHFNSDTLKTAAQTAFLDAIYHDFSQLNPEQLSKVAKIAERYQATEIAEKLLNHCINYTRKISFSENKLEIDTSFIGNKKEVQQFITCQEIIRQLGHLKTSLEIDFHSSEQSRDGVGRYYAEAIKLFPNLQKITTRFDGGDDDLEAIHAFNKAFVYLLPTFTQLQELELISIPIKENNLFAHFILTINHLPHKLKQLTIEFYSIDPVDEYHHFNILKLLDHDQMTSLALQLELCMYDFESNQFPQNPVINKLVLIGDNGEYDCSDDEGGGGDDDEISVLLDNLKALSKCHNIENCELKDFDAKTIKEAQKMGFNTLTWPIESL